MVLDLEQIKAITLGAEEIVLKDKGYAETQVDGVYAWEKGE